LPNIIFKNSCLQVEQVTVKDTQDNDHTKLLVKLTENPKQTIEIDFLEDGYGVLQDNTVNEYNLCNKILYELYEERPNASSVPMGKRTSEYLLGVSGQGSRYSWGNGKLYSHANCKNVFVANLARANKRTDNPDVQKANEYLYLITREMPEKDYKLLVGNDLKYVDSDDPKAHKTRFDCDGKFSPSYTCDEELVRGLLAHADAKMRKDGFLSKNKITFQKLSKSVAKRKEDCFLVKAEEAYDKHNGKIVFENDSAVELVDGSFLSVSCGGKDAERVVVNNVSGDNDFERVFELLQRFSC
jgi:hypothetical protein